MLRERTELPDVAGVEQVVAMTAERVARWRTDELAGCRVVGIGVAVPGLVRSADGLVRRAPHLDWTDEPLRDRLAAATGLEPIPFEGSDSLDNPGAVFQ